MSGMPGGPGRSRAAAIACLLALALAACLLHREVLFGGHVYHMDDAADGYYPGHIAVRRAFAAGELPTWERGSWCGWPLVVDPYNGVFYPLNALYYGLGAARGLGPSVALHVLVGGIGLWLLLRRRRVPALAALLGALAYELSSFGVVRIRHVIFVQMMAWLPWILWAVEGYLARRRRRDLALVAGATALALVAGALSIGHFAALAIAGYTLARCWPADPGFAGPLRWRRFFVDSGLLLAAAVLGALAAAAQIVPTVAHLPYSPRALGSDYRFASSYAWPGAQYLLTLVVPDLYGGEDRLGYHGMPNHWELSGYYAGVVAWLLVPWALAASVRALGRRPAGAGPRVGPELLVLAGLLLLSLLLALGDAAPVHRFFYRHVPLYAALRCPARALLIAVLAVPLLAGHGAAALLAALEARAAAPGRKGPAGGGRPRLAGALAALLLAVAAVALLAGHGPLLDWTRPRLLAGLPLPPRLQLPLGVEHAAVRQALAVTLAALALGVAALGAGLPGRACLGLLALLAAADQLAVDRGYVARYHQPADQPDGMERFAAVEWLRAHGGPPAEGRFVNDPRGPFRLHNLGMVLGLESASGYDSVAVWRYVELLHLLRFGRPYPYHELRDDFAAIGVWNLDSRLLDLMNVRWLLAGDPPGPRWVERFRPSGREGGPAARWEPYWNAHLKVFENTAVLPRAFVVHRAEVPGSDAQLAARLLSPGFDPGATALLEEPPPLPLAATGPPPPPRAASVLEARRHRLLIDTDDPLPGILMVSEVHYPGWTVTVDGQPAPLLRADWTFRGVALPPGHHRVEMRFRSRPTELGLALSLAALLALAALARRAD